MENIGTGLYVASILRIKQGLRGQGSSKIMSAQVGKKGCNAGWKPTGVLPLPPRPPKLGCESLLGAVRRPSLVILALFRLVKCSTLEKHIPTFMDHPTHAVP